MSKDDKQKQGSLFGDTKFDNEWWEEHWQDMPEFNQDDETPIKTIYIHFKTQKDIEAFAELVKQTITSETKSIWYPKVVIERYIDKQYIDS